MAPRIIALACGLALSATIAAAQCTTQTWSTQFSTSTTGLAGLAFATAVFDPDGPGPLPAALYVCGNFASAGGVPGTRGIAKWDGQNWSSVGGGVPASNTVTMLKVFDPDEAGPLPPVLVAIGSFTSIGGIPVSSAAMWNGSTWSPMGSALSNVFLTTEMVEYDPDGPGPLPRVLLFSGGASAGVEFGATAQWNGTEWSIFQGGGGYAVAVYDEDGEGPALPALFFGLDGAPGLMRWDGTQSTVVGGGLTRSALHMCCALRVVDEDGPGPQRPVLLAGGNFTLAGGSTAYGIARWNGTQWSAVGGGIGAGDAQVEDIIAVDYTSGLGEPTLYAFAWGTSTGLKRFDRPTQQWSSTGSFQSQIFGLSHRLMEFSQPVQSVYVVGPFTGVDQTPSNTIARMSCGCTGNCDGSTASPILNANDFQCFLNKFAARDPYANCDQSSNFPYFTANDFQCYLNQYAFGCP